jgi:hypothetical protein
MTSNDKLLVKDTTGVEALAAMLIDRVEAAMGF